MSTHETISLEEARKIREQLSPAFAGYVTDGNISDRDVLATLMDLIVKGKIGFDCDTQRRPVKIRKVYYLGDFTTLQLFETNFIRVLFSKSKELSARDVKEVIASRRLHNVISQNIKSLEDAKIVKSQLLILDDEKKAIELEYNDKAGKSTPVRTIEELEIHRSQLKRKILILVYLVGFMLFLAIHYATNRWWELDYQSELSMYMFNVIFATVLCISSIWGFLRVRRLDKLLIFQFENNIVPFSKGKFDELFDFIAKYPLKQQRIYNEFMPHAVAFGLDTSWNKSFGIATERLVRSRAESHLLRKTV